MKEDTGHSKSTKETFPHFNTYAVREIQQES